MEEAVQPLHDVRFPGESDDYRRARDELLQAEKDLRNQSERVAALRRKLPLGGAIATDYEFEEWDEAAGAGRPVHLSELFDDGKDTLFLYSFMVVPGEQGLPFVGPCPSCTSIMDGIDGAIPHIMQRMSFAVESAAPLAQFREQCNCQPMPAFALRHADRAINVSIMRPRIGAEHRLYDWGMSVYAA